MNHFDLEGNGEPLHFLHANGYPPDCYLPLFAHLQNHFHVFGMKLRPLWAGASSAGLKNWHPFSDDLLKFLTQYTPKPVVGVGHSIGGIVTLRAVLRSPEKFSAVILLDPVLFVPPFLAGWSFVRAVGLGERFHPLIRTAKNRRRVFDNLDMVFERYRTRGIFRFMSDENLKAYIKGITKPKVDGGFELVYSPEWEAYVYLTGLQDFDIWRKLPALEVPTLIIRGAETDTFLEKAERLVTKKNPKIQVHTMQKATHLLPLEHPQQVAEIIYNFTRPDKF